eukprot:gene8804-11887_t
MDDSKQQEEITVLFHASQLGRSDIVKSAIKSLSIVNGTEKSSNLSDVISSKRPQDEMTPLHIATSLGHSDVIRTLLAAGAHLQSSPSIGEFKNKKPYDLANDSTKQVYHVYLFEQVAMGNASSIPSLVKGGIDVDISDGSKLSESPLHWACSFGSTEVAAILLRLGAQVNKTNNDGQSALHFACKNGNENLIRILLSEGSDILLKSKDELTPKDMIPSHLLTKELDELMTNPPVPLFALRNEFLESNKKLDEILTLSNDVTAVAANEVLFESNIEKHDVIQTINSKFNQYIFDDGMNDCNNYDENMANNEDSQPLLIFWPPVKQQKRIIQGNPMVLKSTENVLICMASQNIDIFPLLTWSGLMDTMDSYGFQVQVRRSSVGSKIRLCIDHKLCPIHNSYNLVITSEQISIVASDSNGLIYGVSTFLQLLQLHSTKSTFDHEQEQHTSITIPAITIRDWPDIPTRAVLWSYRMKVRTSSLRMREHIDLFSKLRINTLFLVLDSNILSKNETIIELNSQATSFRTDNGNNIVGISNPIPPLLQRTLSNGEGNDELLSEGNITKLYALDEVCGRHCINLVPTIIITSIHQRLPLDLLRNFTAPSVSVLFAFDESSFAFELNLLEQSDTSVRLPSPESSCKIMCENIINQIHLAGFASIVLSATKWVNEIADPFSIAMKYGISAVVHDLSTMFPSSLFLKPLLTTQDYISSICNYSKR